VQWRGFNTYRPKQSSIGPSARFPKFKDK